MGETAPTVSGIKTYDPSHGSVADQVLVEFDFVWCASFTGLPTGRLLVIMWFLPAACVIHSDML